MKRLLVIVVAVVLVSMMGVVTQVAASNDHAGRFTASGTVCLIQLPTSLSATPSNNGVRIHASGEQLGGFVGSSDGWDALNGAGIQAEIGREVSDFNFASLSFSGRIAGSLTLDTPDGQLSGQMNGTVSGDFLDPANIIDTIYQSTADINWNIGGNGIKARGHATANFYADPIAGTYCGPIEMSGVYIQRGDNSGHNN